MRNSKADGEITVFLSLVLLLIFALTGTIIEATRVHSAGRMAERALESALDSVFSQYGRTLYDDYHVFFLENKEHWDEWVTSSLDSYMEYTIQPEKELKFPGTDYSMKNMNIWGITTLNTGLKEKTYAVDYDGGIFLNQAVNYMKYQVGSEQLEKLLGRMDSIKDTGKTAAVIEEKLKVEESLGEFNQYVMQCMKLIEGISFHRKGVQYHASGLLKTEESFVKQLCSGEITRSNLGINHELVWSSLKSKYINPVGILMEMENDITAVERMEQELLSLQEQLEQLARQDTKSKEPEDMESREKQLESIQDTMENLRKEMKNIVDNIEKKQKLILKKSSDVIEKIDQVLVLLPQITKKQDNMASELQRFETVLLESRADIPDEIYGAIEEDSNYMRQYAGKENSKTDVSMAFCITEMKPLLEQNRSILKKCRSLGNVVMKGRTTDWPALRSEIKLQIHNLQGYQVKQLSFDYSSLRQKQEVADPVGAIGKLLGNGIMELVLADTEQISKKAITVSDQMYLQQNGQPPDAGEEGTDLKQVLTEAGKSGYSSEITDSFGEYHVQSEFGNNLKHKANELGDLILWGEYMDSHFKSFVTEEEQMNTLTALEYEKEYSIGARKTDKENLQTTINKLVTLRTIINFIYIISDQEKKGTAYATAAALVGYTCMEPLIRLTQMLVLVVWSFAEALVDTAAILSGKSIPLQKTRSSFLVEYPELFLMNKAFIQKKAEQIPSGKSGGITLDYEAYIKLFLLMTGQKKLVYRSMDLIQENLRLRYRKDFDISQCVYGIGVETEWEIPAKFIRLGFVQRILGQKKGGWKISHAREYSY